jgi:hypothetical protein
MSATVESDTEFPIRVGDPESYRRGPVFLADLVAFGPCRVSPRIVARATCTIAHRFRAVEPEVVKVWDRFTARIQYADGITHQVEYVLDGEAIAEETIKRVQMNRWEQVYNLVLVASGPIESDARTQAETFGNIDIITIDIDEPDDMELSIL